MNTSSDIDALPEGRDSTVPPGAGRLVLIGLFMLVIALTVGFGFSALQVLSARTTQVNGPASPVPGILDSLHRTLDRLAVDDHGQPGRFGGADVPTAERLAPLLEEFSEFHRRWQEFSESELAVDVLLSRRLSRQLEGFEIRFASIAGPLATAVEPRPAEYDELLREAHVLGTLIDETRRAQLEAARATHAADMQEIFRSTQVFVYLGVLALIGFVALSGLYLWQMRRYDRSIASLNRLSQLLSSASGVPLFEGLVGFLGEELGHAYVFIGKINPGDPQQVDTLAVFAHGKLAGNISYRLPGTPCENVLQRGVCFYPSGVQQAFPEDRLLQEMGVDSYAGTPLLNSQDYPLGILVLLDARPINPKSISSPLIQIVASRAQAELERMRTEEMRTSTMDGLEARVDARTADLRRINDQLEEEVGQRREIEQQLERARLAAEGANRAKGEFLANASHEIRTHINGLLGMLSLLEDGDMKGEQLEYVEMAHASGDVLLTLINDLLDYSKIEAGQLTIEEIDFDFDQLVGEIGDLFGVRARASGLEFDTEISAELPHQLRGDVVRIRQVLSNLVDNALKFTGKGRVALRVSAAGAGDDGRALVRFEVEDTGIGFDPAKRELLFQPFSQADNSITRRYGGTGLGLAICAQLVRLLGGEIDVDGAPGLGTRFWFTIPLQTPLVDDGEAAREVTRDSLEGLRVLVVDDSAVSRAYLRSLLVAWHIDCDVVDDGKQGLAALTEAAEAGRLHDLVILDRLMPEMDGLELASRIAGDPALASVKLVMVTRYGGAVAADEAMRSGVSGYLNKPVSQSQLFDVLVKVTGLQPRTRRSAPPPSVAATGRILVVEDNQVNQKVAVGMLRKLGYRADTAVDGQQAVAAIQREGYDLVLMDCQMPVMDGYTATREIRDREHLGRHLPIVAMTAHALGGEREKCLAAGMDDYLAKPVRIADLKQKIDYWCGSASEDASGGGDDTASHAAEESTMTQSVPSDPGSQPRATADAPLDSGTLEELRDVMGDDIRELIDAYLDDTARRLDELDRAVGSAPEVLVTVAHTLKGSSANVGARAFAERCAAVHQRAAADGSDPQLRELVDGLGGAFEEVRLALEGYRATVGSG
jgi:signal transduction histidine kinase/DNA-binding response OmpR family regulator/HPt (histidine-containing phosphotransfer) domain-containing protein